MGAVIGRLALVLYYNCNIAISVLEGRVKHLQNHVTINRLIIVCFFNITLLFSLLEIHPLPFTPKRLPCPVMQNYVIIMLRSLVFFGGVGEALFFPGRRKEIVREYLNTTWSDAGLYLIIYCHQI